LIEGELLSDERNGHPTLDGGVPEVFIERLRLAFQHSRNMSEDRWDYIVVGGGTAGSIVAARLSEDSTKHVLLLEAGDFDSYLPFKIPGLGFLANNKDSCNWWFETEAVPELNDRKLVWLQGKILGGSSSINGMIYTRGHAREYDSWRQMGCEGWGSDDVLPYFKKVEAHERGDSELHSGSGAVPVRRSRPTLPIYDAFLGACARDGFPVVDDLNANVIDGFGFYDVNIRKGRRVSAASAYLRPAMRRGNLTIWTNAEVRRIIFSGKRAVAVEVFHQGQRKIASAHSEIIICGGAVKSPQLLMLSGIGAADELNSCGIDVVVDSPGVGKNLQNHASYRMQYACDGQMTAFNYLTPIGMIKAALSYALFRTGGLAESIFGAGGFFRTESHLETPDIQVVMCGALLAKPTSIKPKFWELLPKQQGFSLVVYQGKPFSRGSISLRSSDANAAPVIRTGYFEDRRDIQILMSGIKRLRRVCMGSGRPISISREISPGENIVSDDDLEREVRANVGTSYHQSGTCAMGRQKMSVVDARLRVIGVEGLRVADASIMPVLPTAAIHGPVMMIAEKAVAMIVEDNKAPVRSPANHAASADS
jgi:choline dehydrogenase